jgi:hypothetical protein
MSLLYRLLAQGNTQGSMLQQCTNKTLTIGPFRNTCKANEVSLEVEPRVVAGLNCLQPYLGHKYVIAILNRALSTVSSFLVNQYLLRIENRASQHSP